MGYGDSLLGTGLAKGAATRGKRIAFGNQGRIQWDQHSAEIFKGNPNIAKPGSEKSTDIEWIDFCKGHRGYNSHDQANHRWVWNYEWKATPGEMFFTDQESLLGKRYGKGFVVIESGLPRWKATAVNKDWGRRNYQAVADKLKAEGHRVVQFSYGNGTLLNGVQALPTRSFRDALSILRVARLYIGPEGGLHHGAAALGIGGVVLFGGFIPPSVTGYALHTNLTGGVEACGSLRPCEHCRLAMSRISVEEVIAAATTRLNEENP